MTIEEARAQLDKRKKALSIWQITTLPMLFFVMFVAMAIVHFMRFQGLLPALSIFGSGALYLKCASWRFKELSEEIWTPCNRCGAKTSSATIWFCGECKLLNREVALFEHPFLSSCKHCKAKPRGFVCTHCNEGMFEGNDQDQHLFGYKEGANPLPRAPQPPDPIKVNRERARDDISWEIEVAQLNAKLERQLADVERAKGERYEAQSWQRKPESPSVRLKQHKIKQAIQEIEMIESTIHRASEQLARKWREKENVPEDEIDRRLAKVKTAAIQAAKETAARK